ncbi:beta-galactosidase [Streptomyces sp. WMMB 322]|uniref:beta-galactosidase n=1 Tax=Streptomyces sp. WMMB 322 TaxID=1286821 RepID=UPI0006E15EE9|nr:beta-galactosidase [Streptomyces sp. WMMB 322]SCK56572.1 beta-galactosidase [Streptomyces sp. WMMB 322]
MSRAWDRLGGRLGRIAYGGDYNPEQWPRPVWREDARLMREAGVNLVTVGVFSWAVLEPRPGHYDFGLTDEVLDLMHDHGIAVDLATPTAAPPPWFSRLHPEALPVTADGTRLWHGSRQAFCPSSPAYTEYASALVEELAKRYADHPALALWHVHNEWGNHNAHCFCDTSAAAFRRWLRQKYGTLDELNHAWGTAFWSQRYGDWEEIMPPLATPAFVNPTQHLDHQRFSSGELLALHRREAGILRRHSPGVPLTTNLMGTLEKKTDGFAFAPECDLISVDHYLTAADPRAHIGLSLDADLARGMASGEPWILMEHSTSAVNWQPRNVAKTPGQMRRNSLAHLARGADGIMFFQWRQSRAGAEKWHSAMLPHGGTDTEIWREVTSLGAALDSLAEVRGSRVRAEVAVLFDWQAWWALELEARPSQDLRYLDLVRRWYEALWSNALTCDLVHPGADLSSYRLVLVPSLYATTDADASSLAAFVERGGQAAIGFFSGVADEHDHVRLGGHPGAYRELLGLRAEEFHPLREDETIALSDGSRAGLWSERIRADGAETVLSFAADASGGPVPGGPAVTRHPYGRGSAWYIATAPEEGTLRDLLRGIAGNAGVSPAANVPIGVEAVRRHGCGTTYLFLINHTDQPARVAAEGRELLHGTQVTGLIDVPPGDVAVIREDPHGHDGPPLQAPAAHAARPSWT